MLLKLHPKQSFAFNSPANEILFGGAAGGGKSHLMRCALITWCLECPGLQGYLFRRLSDDLVKNHLLGPTGFETLLADMISTGYARINYSKNIINFYNGSRIFLCHFQHWKDRHKYQGPEIHVLCIDEITHFEERMYKWIRSRARLGAWEPPAKYKGFFPKIINGGNPGGIGHGWVKKTWVDPKPEKLIWRTPKKQGYKLRQYIPSKLHENPTMDENYKYSLEGIGPAWLVQAMLEGDWNISIGGMFDDLFRTEIHVVPPFEIPSSWYIDRTFDWGSAKPSAVLWFAESDGTGEIEIGDKVFYTERGDLFLIAEHYSIRRNSEGEFVENEGTRETAGEIAQKIIDREKNDWNLKNFTVNPGSADSSIFSTENDNCIADDMAEKGCYWLKANKSPGSRINGAQVVRRLLKGALKGEEPGLYIFNTCGHSIRTIPTLPADENNPNDINTNAEDHCYDALRYRVLKPKSENTFEDFTNGTE